MTDQQQFRRDQRHHQRQSHQQHQDRKPPGNPQVQRREFLWRERVKLELQVQALISRAKSLDMAWRALQQRKASLEQRKPKLATQIVLSGLLRTRSLPAERLFHYERERLMQEEERLRQAIIFCQGDLAALQAQIEVISWSGKTRTVPGGGMKATSVLVSPDLRHMTANLAKKKNTNL